RGHDHRLRLEREPPDLTARTRLAARDLARFEHGSAGAVDGAVSHADLVHPVSEEELQTSAPFRLAGAPHEGLDDAGPGAPGEMKPRYRIAMRERAAATPLRPADDRKEPVAHRAQPRSLLAG